jgi:hypothetical protein
MLLVSGISIPPCLSLCRQVPALIFINDNINPHCAESPISAMKKNIFDKFQPILG